MPEFRCVKCGTLVNTDDPDYRSNRRVAPSCPDCREAVEKEVKKNYSTWPFDWRGGWMWDRPFWQRVKVYGEDADE